MINDCSLPCPIYQIFKENEVITMEALSPTQYEKCYFSNYELGKPLENPRKTKIVNVENVWDVFNNCRKSGYMIIPQE